MNNYKVVILPNAQKNLDDITFCISEMLKSPLAAVNLELELIEAILSLKENPYRAPLFSDNFRLTPMEEVRKLIIDNYLILFYMDENLYQVNVVSVRNRLKNESRRSRPAQSCLQDFEFIFSFIYKVKNQKPSYSNKKNNH